MCVLINCAFHTSFVKTHGMLTERAYLKNQQGSWNAILQNLAIFQQEWVDFQCSKCLCIKKVFAMVTKLGETSH